MCLHNWSHYSVWMSRLEDSAWNCKTCLGWKTSTRLWARFHSSCCRQYQRNQLNDRVQVKKTGDAGGPWRGTLDRFYKHLWFDWKRNHPGPKSHEPVDLLTIFQFLRHLVVCIFHSVCRVGRFLTPPSTDSLQRTHSYTHPDISQSLSHWHTGGARP